MIEKLIHPSPREESARPFHAEVDQLADREWRRERDRVKGRMLLETLRYKQYERHRTLRATLSHIGGQVRRREGFWYYAAWASAAAAYVGIYGWAFR